MAEDRADPLGSAPWKTTRLHLRQDRERLARVLADRDGVAHGTWLHPSFLCVVLYRVARCLHVKGHTFLARLFGQVNTLLTGADISPASDIGGGLVVVSPAGAALFGKAGRNLTVMPGAGIGGELGRREDVGGGPGLPVLGDDVVLEAHVGVLGPCRIGDRARIVGGTLVLRDVPADTVVEGPRPRFRARRDLP